MSETKKRKTVKVGAIIQNEGKQPVLILGNSRATNPKYNFDVGLRVIDSEGNELAKIQNGMLVLSDPRRNPNLTEEQKQKISSKLLYEVLILE